MSQDMSDFFVACDWGYMDRLMAEPDATHTHAVESRAGQEATTHHTIDIYQVGLAVFELLTGKLPDAINFDSYTMPEESGKFLQAVWDYDWGSCAELMQLPAPARDFILWVKSPEPQHRPQTGAEALQHPFVSDAVQRVVAAAQAAAPAWLKAHDELFDALYTDAPPASHASLGSNYCENISSTSSSLPAPEPDTPDDASCCSEAPSTHTGSSSSLQCAPCCAANGSQVPGSSVASVSAASALDSNTPAVHVMLVMLQAEAQAVPPTGPSTAEAEVQTDIIPCPTPTAVQAQPQQESVLSATEAHVPQHDLDVYNPVQHGGCVTAAGPQPLQQSNFATPQWSAAGCISSSNSNRSSCGTNNSRFGTNSSPGTNSSSSMDGSSYSGRLGAAWQHLYGGLKAQSAACSRFGRAVCDMASCLTGNLPIECFVLACASGFKLWLLQAEEA